MFFDEAKIYVKAGNGGDGSASFRHEKYVPKGGPDGGDGGNGGSVIISADSHTSDLSYFNRIRKFSAENGQNGMGKKMHGKNGDDLKLNVPLGTQIFEDDKLVADLAGDAGSYVAVSGGQGGWGNVHFATSIKQAPKWSKKGLFGESKRLNLELKMIADVGLIGLPNAGKSTLLSVISNARPKVADYPFTTLTPNLGVIKGIDRNVIVADIPGLIEGASAGRGLGDRFLKHIERTNLLVHVIDSMSDDVIRDYKTIRKELEEFSKNLSSKNEIVVLNKTDVESSENIKSKIGQFEEISVVAIPISAAANKGIEELIKVILSELNHPNKVKNPAGHTLKSGGIVVLERQGKKYVLMIQRPRHNNEFSFPKGHLEPGEDEKKAAIREIFEETGVVVSDGTDLPDFEYVNKMNPKGITCKMFLFRSEKVDLGEKETDEIPVWVLLNEVKENLNYQNIKDYFASISSKIDKL